MRLTEACLPSRHASAERVLSGPGIVNLYEALCALADVAPAPLTPAQITHPNAQDTQAREATAMFAPCLERRPEILP